MPDVLNCTPPELGDKLGGVGSGVLFVMYTVSAFLVATPLVQRLGSKWALTASLGLYCFYTASFLVAALAPSVKWPVAIGGSVIGGFAAGWLWTAQGAYFARTAELYAHARGEPVTRANALLAGVFGSMYVGLEVVFKLLSSGLDQAGGSSLVYGLFTSAAVLATLGMAFVRPLPTPSEVGSQMRAPDAPDCDDRAALIQQEPSSASGAEEYGSEVDALVSSPKVTDDVLPPSCVAVVWRKSTLALRLLISDPKIALLGPLNLSFGFVGSFLNYYINGTITKEAVGKANIGYMTATTAGMAALVSVPLGLAAKRTGNLPLMILGALAYISVSMSVYSMSDAELIGMHWGVIYIYLIQGIGRAIFETTNKAVFADFFPDNKEGAFSNVIFFSGAYCYASGGGGLLIAASSRSNLVHLFFVRPRW